MTASIGDISFSQSQGYQNYPQNNPGLGSKEQDQAGSTYPSDPVRLSLSPEAEKMIKQAGQGEQPGMAKDKDSKSDLKMPGEKKDIKDQAGKPSGQKKLTESEQKMVSELQQRDRDVHAHEEAHAAVAGSFAIGGPNYDYETGPDGKSYAIGGNVKLDMSPESTPAATIAKMETIQHAALAPSDPSGDDRAVASSAAKVEDAARQEENQEFTLHQQALTRQFGGKSRTDHSKITFKGGTYGMSNVLHPRGQILNGVA